MKSLFGPGPLMLSENVKENLLRLFEEGGLRQYPPQSRTMFFQVVDYALKQVLRTGESFPLHLKFPCLSFADGWKTRLGWDLVYAHERPWADYRDAIDVLKCLPNGFFNAGSYGYICLGVEGTALVHKRKKSLEDVFWNTTNTIHVPNRYELDTQKALDRGLRSIQWDNLGIF